jgi:hypothetical protein
MPVVISETVLVLAGPLGERLDGEHAAAALAGGLTADGLLEADLCSLEDDLDTRTADPSAPLDEVDFDRRMRAARAIVLVCASLDDRMLARSVAFEAATRARQSGVPAYAVTAHNTLDAFEARIVDLQAIFEAGTARELSAAGRKLTRFI